MNEDSARPTIGYLLHTKDWTHDEYEDDSYEWEEIFYDINETFQSIRKTLETRPHPKNVIFTLELFTPPY